MKLPMGTYNNLLGEGFKPSLELEKRSVFVVKENGCKFRMEGMEAYFSCGFQIDGDVISDGEAKCDKLLLIALDKDQKAIGEMVNGYVYLSSLRAQCRACRISARRHAQTRTVRLPTKERKASCLCCS